MTDDPDMRIATVVMDYLFRRLALDYLPYEKRAELGIFSAEERAAQVGPRRRRRCDVEGAAPRGVDVDAAPRRSRAVRDRRRPVEVGCSTELLELRIGQGRRRAAVHDLRHEDASRRAAATSARAAAPPAAAADGRRRVKERCSTGVRRVSWLVRGEPRMLRLSKCGAYGGCREQYRCGHPGRGVRRRRDGGPRPRAAARARGAAGCGHARAQAAAHARPPDGRRLVLRRPLRARRDHRPAGHAGAAAPAHRAADRELDPRRARCTTATASAATP